MTPSSEMKRPVLMKPIVLLLGWSGVVPVGLLSPCMPNDDRPDRHRPQDLLKIFAPAGSRADRVVARMVKHRSPRVCAFEPEVEPKRRRGARPRAACAVRVFSGSRCA